MKKLLQSAFKSFGNCKYSKTALAAQTPGCFSKKGKIRFGWKLLTLEVWIKSGIFIVIPDENTNMFPILTNASVWSRCVVTSARSVAVFSDICWLLKDCIGPVFSMSLSTGSVSHVLAYLGFKGLFRLAARKKLVIILSSEIFRPTISDIADLAEFSEP